MHTIYASWCKAFYDPETNVPQLTSRCIETHSCALIRLVASTDVLPSVGVQGMTLHCGCSLLAGVTHRLCQPVWPHDVKDSSLVHEFFRSGMLCKGPTPWPQHE
eukprot:374533-Amphidinium_carterae.2